MKPSGRASDEQHTPARAADARRCRVTDDDQAILDANAVLYAAFNARDVEAMEALWATSAPVSCVHPGWNVIFGRVEVMDSWRAILTNPDQPRIVAGGAELRRYGDCAVVICRELVAGNP